MNIVVLSTCTPANAFLIRAVAARHPIRRVFRLTWEAPPRRESRFAKFGHAPINSVVSLARRKFFEHLHDHVERRAAAMLAPFDAAGKEPPVSNINRWQVNSPCFAEQLHALDPDVLLVSAGPILKPEIFEIPKLGTLNVHRGIAPAYRGERTLFNALYDDDLANVGVTLHQIDRGIDTGPVLKYGLPALAPDDDEATLTAKCMRLAATMVGDALDEAELYGFQGVRQAGSGRCCYAREQRIWKEAWYRLLRITGRRRIAPRTQKVVTLSPRLEQHRCGVA